MGQKITVVIGVVISIVVSIAFLPLIMGMGEEIKSQASGEWICHKAVEEAGYSFVTEYSYEITDLGESACTIVFPSGDIIVIDYPEGTLAPKSTPPGIEAIVDIMPIVFIGVVVIGGLAFTISTFSSESEEESKSLSRPLPKLLPKSQPEPEKSPFDLVDRFEGSKFQRSRRKEDPVIVDTAPLLDSSGKGGFEEVL